MPALRVNRSVNNYHYRSQGNVCSASNIMVTSDKTGDTMGDSFDAFQARTASVTPVSSCMETCCKTFVAKGSGKEQADRVTRTR